MEESIHVVGGISSIVGHGQAIQQEVASAGHGQGVAGSRMSYKQNVAEGSYVVGGISSTVGMDRL